MGNFNIGFCLIKEIGYKNGYDNNHMDKILHKKSFQSIINLVYPFKDRVKKFHTSTDIGEPSEKPISVFTRAG